MDKQRPDRRDIRRGRKGKRILSENHSQDDKPTKGVRRQPVEVENDSEDFVDENIDESSEEHISGGDHWLDTNLLELPSYIRNRYDIRYGLHYSRKEEKRVQQKFDEDYQFSVQDSNSEEKALYRKSLSLWKVLPQYIIPAELEVYIERNKSSKTNPNTETVCEWMKKDWNSNFCKAFGITMCIPAFENDMAYLQHILRKSVAIRIGKNLQDKAGLTKSTIPRHMQANISAVL